MNKFEVGQYVEIVDNLCNHAFSIGSVVQIIDTEDGEAYEAYGIDQYGDLDYWWIYPSDAKEIAPTT